MPRAEVPAHRAEDRDGAAGHVLAAVVAGALHHRGGAGVADAEALAHAAGHEQLAAGGAVEAGVAGKDGQVGRVVVRRADDHQAAAHALADVVVGLAGEVELDSVGQEGGEALTRGAGQAHAAVPRGGSSPYSRAMAPDREAPMARSALRIL